MAKQMKVTIPKEAGLYDPYFRYKREYTSIKYINKGGGRTQIVNADIIAKNLKRTEKMLCKHLKTSLGRAITEDFIIQGIVTAEEIDSKIEDFVRTMVLCPKCNNPETYFNSNNTKANCEACGHRWSL